MIYTNLNPKKALIWRIIHRDNLEWILDEGIHCANSKILSPNYVNIGNSELINKRRQRQVPLAPGGTLADYVPFYFTPFSVMMKNIHSGRSVRQRKNDEIVILVSSVYHVLKLGHQLIFTNAHAYPNWTDYYSDVSYLNQIDWSLLQHRDFSRDADDPQKMERYQAEALIYKHLPIEGLLGIVCYDEQTQKNVERQVLAHSLDLPVHVRPNWYF